MAAPTQSHLAMIRRHRQAMVRFAAVSILPADKLAFVIAGARSTMGQVMRQHGLLVTGRESVVLPISVDAVPELLAAAGCDEVHQLVSEHGAVKVVAIDDDGTACVTWEWVLRSAVRNGAQTRAITSGENAGQAT